MDIYKIDGTKVKDFESFITEMNKNFISKHGDSVWNGNLDAFNDYLNWPQSKYQFVFENSESIKEGLSFEATLLWLTNKLERCHPSNTDSVSKEIELAKSKKGQTLYDIILEIIEDNKDKVSLVLK